MSCKNCLFNSIRPRNARVTNQHDSDDLTVQLKFRSCSFKDHPSDACDIKFNNPKLNGMMKNVNSVLQCSRSSKHGTRERASIIYFIAENA